MQGWRKSSYSGADCVEINNSDDQFRVRDSKAQGESILAFESVRMNAFVAQVKCGDFNE